MLLYSSCLESEREAEKLPEFPKYFRSTGFCRWEDNKVLKRALKVLTVSALSVEHLEDSFQEIYGGVMGKLPW